MPSQTPTQGGFSRPEWLIRVLLGPTHRRRKKGSPCFPEAASPSKEVLGLTFSPPREALSPAQLRSRRIPPRIRSLWGQFKAAGRAGGGKRARSWPLPRPARSQTRPRSCRRAPGCWRNPPLCPWRCRAPVACGKPAREWQPRGPGGCCHARPPALPPPAGRPPGTWLASFSAAPAASCLAEGGGPSTLPTAASWTRRRGLCARAAGPAQVKAAVGPMAEALPPGGAGPGPLHSGARHLDLGQLSARPPDAPGRSRLSSPGFCTLLVK